MPRWCSLVVVLVGLLGCAADVSLGAQRDGAPMEVEADGAPADVGFDAPPDVAADAVSEASPDGATEDSADAPDVGDAPGDRAPAADPVCVAGAWGTLGPAAAEVLARGNVVDVRVPPARCATRATSAIVLYKLRLDRRTGVRLMMDSSKSVAVRRSCADPASEVACARVVEDVPARFVLDAGEYDVLFEQDPFRSFSPQRVRFEPFSAPPAGLDGDRCEGAVEVAPDATLPVETLGHATAPHAGCLTMETGPAAYYKTRVPAGARLVVTAFPNALDGAWRNVASRFRATVRLLPSCGAAACLAASAAPASGAASAGWTNATGAPAEVIAVIAGAADRPGGRFALTFRTVDAMANTACDRATELTDGATLRGQDLTAATAPPAPCSVDGGASGPVLFYRARVPPLHQLAVRTTPDTIDRADVPTVLRVHPACGSAECVGSRTTWTLAYTGQLALWQNYDAEARDVIVTLGALTSAASPVVDLRAWIRPIDANERCDRAFALPASGAVDGFTTDGAPDTQEQCTWALTSTEAVAGVRYYRVTVPPRSETRVSVDRWAEGARLQIRTIDGCAARRCGPEAPEEPVRLANAGAAAREFLFLVGRVGSSPTSDRYGLRTETAALGTEPACADARVLAVPSRALETTLPAPVGTPASCQNPQGARVRYYRATAPARSILSLYTEARMLSRMAVLRACGGACSNPDQEYATWPAPRYVNDGDAPAEVTFALQTWDPAVAPYSVFVRAAPIAPNGTCATAQAVALGTTLRGLDPGGGRDGSPHYRTPIGRQGLFYRVRIEAGESMAVRATQRDGVAGSWGLVLAALPSCDFVNPLAQAYVMRPSPTTGLQYTNADAAAREVVVVAEAMGALAGTFDLEFVRATAAVPGACERPTVLHDGDTLRGLALPAAVGVGATSASSYLQLAASVPAGHEFSLRGTAPMNLRAARTCGGPEVAQMSNTRGFVWSFPGGADGEIRLALQAADVGATQTDLTVAIRPQPYLRAAITASCDALPADAAEALPAGDAASQVRPLPFAWTYFGEPVRGWSVAASGFLQVWPDLTGTPRGDVSPDFAGAFALPAAEAPPRAIAPFWSTLERGPTSRVRFATVETPRRHLTVEWADLRPCCGGVNPLRATFQAKLFADDGTVEFHYCAQTTATLVGAGAAVGLQDATGTSGARVTARVSGTSDADLERITAGSGWRFTPRP